MPTSQLKTHGQNHRQTRNQSSAILELSLAGALWGFGFIAAIWALREMGPLTMTGWRFAIACAVGLLISLLSRRLRSGITWNQFFLAAIPGVLLGAALLFQTWGLQYTTATKSGFITTLYALIIPLLERIWLRRRLPKYHFFFVFLALIGVALICQLAGIADPTQGSAQQAWNFGDFLTLLCSFCASLQILWFIFIAERIGPSFTFNSLINFWAGLFPLILSFFLEPFPSLTLGITISPEPLIGFLMLTFGSTLIAFALQVRAQKVITPSIASLLFLLESPFATLFAIYFLNESLKTSQWIGAALILTAAGLSSVFASRETHAKMRAEKSLHP